MEIHLHPKRRKELMADVFDKLNLRPQEKRWVVGVLVVVLIVLNHVFIWPYFFEWSQVRGKIRTSQNNIVKFQEEIRRDKSKGGYADVLKKIDEVKGNTMQMEGDIQLERIVMKRAKDSNVSFSNLSTIKNNTKQTNEFFVEQTVKVNIEADEEDVIDFLYKICEDNSMIRVRELTLGPADAKRYQLKGTITLSANYQKKPEVKAAVSKTPTNRPPSKPTLVSAPKKAPEKAAGKSGKPHSSTPGVSPKK